MSEDLFGDAAPEGSPSGVELDDKPAEHTVSEDSPVGSGAAKQQRFADQYNRHQFPLGKTRTNSSKNRRIHTRFVTIAVRSCHARIGYIDGVHVGRDRAKGVVF